MLEPTETIMYTSRMKKENCWTRLIAATACSE